MSSRIGFPALAAVAIAAGCGGSLGGAPPPDYARALRGAPQPLAALYSQADELLPGGRAAFEKRLKALRGYPVVVNVWASWCGDCMYEFPFLQKASARFGTRVAFVGVDSEDSESGAAAWLGEAPVPYPSYLDPRHELARSYEAIGLPVTAFYDRRGKLAWIKQGSYRDAAELEGEVEKLALEAS